MEQASRRSKKFIILPVLDMNKETLKFEFTEKENEDLKIVATQVHVVFANIVE